MKKIAIIFITLILIYISSLTALGSNKLDYFRSLLGEDTKNIIKEYVFPYKYINQLKDKNKLTNKKNQILEEKSKKLNQKLENKNLLIEEIGHHLHLAEISYGLDNDHIKLERTKIDLSNNFELQLYKIQQGFYAGINNVYPGTGFIDFHENKLFILSARGLLGYTNDIEKLKIKLIRNNIHEFINLKQFEKNKWFSIKDLYIQDSQIYVSFTEEIKEDCFNTSVIVGDINLESIRFQKLFSSDECIHIYNNPDKEFNAHQSGGRIINFEDNILLTVGDYRSRYLAQDKLSINGKIILIELKKGSSKVISMGHRNPQGLFYDDKNQVILSTEHGPSGGDEINLISSEDLNLKNPLNFGWAIVSNGEHYRGKIEENLLKYEKYPLYKSHTKYGFIEPLKTFVPSIGISEIISIGNEFVVGSMRDKSLYFFKLDQNFKTSKFERIEVNERVRDLKFHNNKIYMFLEDSASIGIIEL